MKNRVITYIFDTIEEKIVDVDHFIDSKSVGFNLRRDYNIEPSRFKCIMCEQVLISAYSSNDNIYFRHGPNSDYCILREKGLTDEIFEGYLQMAYARESLRHKKLKLKIGESLKLESLVDVSTIDIDSKFISGKNGHKRRPDVYCDYNGKRIAFEIQLSYLPLHYIQHREKFYKENGIYLIWIIDLNISPKHLDSFQRDIKYIWEHQNLFMVNEFVGSGLQLDCNFKKPFIFENNAVHVKWIKKKIGLADLLFDESIYACFFFDFKNAKKNIEQQLSTIIETIKTETEEKEAYKKKELIKGTIKEFLLKFKFYKERDYNFYTLAQAVKNLELEYVKELNHEINLISRHYKGVPLILVYIRDYVKKNKDTKMTIVEFLFSSDNIQIEINVKDRNGDGVIQYLYRNASLKNDLYKIKQFLFVRNYKLLPNDKTFLIQQDSKNGLRDYLELSYYSKCYSMDEIKIVKNMLAFLLFVESAINKQITGSKLTNWVQYCVPIMNNYRSYWKFIKLVLDKTFLGEELKYIDKKGTIQRKIKELNLKEIECDSETSNVLLKIYPNIFA